MAEVWNASDPQTSNVVLSDVAKIQENFSYIEDFLFNNVYKMWSSSSTAISKNSLYFASPALDQGGTTNTRSLKSIYDTVGATKRCTIICAHYSADGNTTTYTTDTSLTLPTVYTVAFENGCTLAGSGTLAIDGNLILLGNATISGTVSVGQSLVCFGDLTVSGTLTLGAGSKLTVHGELTTSGTLTRTEGCLTNIHGTLYESTTTATTSGTGTDPLIGLTIPADMFQAGDIIRVKGGGVITPDASGNTATIQLRFGTSYTTLGTSVSTSTDTAYWASDLTIQFTGDTELTIVGNNATTGAPLAVTVSSGIDLTATQVLRFYASNSRAGSTVNQISMAVEAR